MRQNYISKLSAAVIMAAVLAMPFTAFAQTQVTMPSNKYKVQDDVKLGNDAAREVEKQFPILNDADATRYVERIGGRLVASIPENFRQPAFDYRFKIVNASDLNAFALPGGPMYVDRGMIEAAKNEGELAGVMAHEISHVALRHATAQQTKVNNPLNQILGIGAILGGALILGETGAQLGQAVATGYFMRYSRAYETQADVLGSHIMADAGYDPRDLANVFKTIASQEKGSMPEWLSSHPDPGNRYESINREAQYLNVSPNPIKVTRDFERIRTRLMAMPKAKSMAEIEKESKAGQTTAQSPTAGGKYSSSVPYPSARVRTYGSNDSLQINVPSNWKEFPSNDSVMFAPAGAYGDQGITHGAMIGIFQGKERTLLRASQEYTNSVLQANDYLKQRTGYTQVYLDNRQGYSISLSGVSPVTGRTEMVTVYTTLARNGQLLYIITVVPQNESNSYTAAFRNMIRSVRLNDQ